MNTLRVAGAITNSGRSALRVQVFAVQEDAFQNLGQHTDGKDTPILVLYYIDIRPTTTVDLRDHAPRDPAALARMVTSGPVRIGFRATSSGGDGAVQLEAINAPTSNRTLGVFVRSRNGESRCSKRRLFRATVLPSRYRGDDACPRGRMRTPLSIALHY
jgi:hypothetical protein